MVRVLHFITGLGVGGAERMLCKLLASMDPARFEQHVISLTGIGPLGADIRALGIPVSSLGITKGQPLPTSALKVLKPFRKNAPDVIQTWMYHANLVGSLAAPWLHDPPVVWNIRRGRLDPKRDRRGTLWCSRVCASLSRKLPSRVICCSHSSRDWHVEHGYAPEKMTVVPNGFDLRRFSRDAQARCALRSELSIPCSADVFGLVARFDPTKDHQTFLRAAAQIHRKLPEAHFILCGTGIDWTNAAIADPIRNSGNADRFHLLGPRGDVENIMASIDVLISSSVIESFPNAIGEAMACETPCAVTDVGDSAYIVGDTGRIFPSQDPAALASACVELIRMAPEKRTDLGRAARRRVIEKFSLPAVAGEYSNLYEEIADVRHSRIR